MMTISVLLPIAIANDRSISADNDLPGQILAEGNLNMATLRSRSENLVHAELNLISAYG